MVGPGLDDGLFKWLLGLEEVWVICFQGSFVSQAISAHVHSINRKGLRETKCLTLRV